MNRITLKNVKHAEFASEETNCFEASVYFDGQYAGSVSNDGHGGSNLWDFPKKAPGYPLLVDYAKALPSEIFSLSGADHVETVQWQPDADSLVDQALEEYLTERELKRRLSGRVLFIASDGTLRTTKKVGAETVARWLSPEQREKAAAAWNTTVDKILNLMTPAAALAAYKEHG